jgi:hypothetical protein
MKGYFLIISMFIVTVVTGQVAVNNDGSVADGSAMLDVKSTTKGMLIPRMSSSQRTAISSPAAGLMVFDTDENAFFYYDVSNGWLKVGYGVTGWYLNGSSVFTDSLHKVVVGDSSTNGVFEVATDKATGNYSADRCINGNASAQESYPGKPASNAFDDNDLTYWSNNGTLPSWLQYDFGENQGKVISRYRIYYGSGSYDSSPDSWDVEASNDGTSWTTLDSRSGEGWTSNAWKEYTFGNDNRYRYYRLNFTNNKGTTDDYVSVYEVEMLEMLYEKEHTLFITDNKVGIGTDAPQAKLDINGSFRFDDGNQATGKILSSDASGNAAWVDGSSVNGGGWTVSGNYIFNLNDSVSIGNGTPGARLDVSGRISITGTGGSVYIGHGAGSKDDFSSTLGNVFIGENTGQNNTSGFYNTAIGYETFYYNRKGNYNTSIGCQSLGSLLDSGDYNVAVGYMALSNKIKGNCNIAVGSNALKNDTAGTHNIAIGNEAMGYSSYTVNNNIAIGDSSLYKNGKNNYGDEGHDNLAFGLCALRNNISGHNNVAMGNWSLYKINNGDNNVAIGDSTLSHNLKGGWNIAIGSSALKNDTAGSNNIAIGYKAMGYSSYTSGENIAIGNFSLYKTGKPGWWTSTGYDNIALGESALYNNTEGNYNVGIGNDALYKNNTGGANVAVGYGALYNNNGGTNIALGYEALYNNTSGNRNIAIGYWSSRQNTTGSYNVAIGDNSGFGVSLDNTTCIGSGSGGIANNDNRVEIGNTSVNWIGGQVTWSTYSDERIKKNVKNDVAGLSFITKLRPVTYYLDIHKQNRLTGKVDTATWRGKYDIEKMKMTGFIAQEVEHAAQECGYDFSGVQKGNDNVGMYSISYAQFVVPLVKAVQEQQEIIERQKQQISVMQNKIRDLENMKKEWQELKKNLFKQ